MTGTTQRTFTVERLVWQRHGDRWLTVPGADPVRTFADRATAAATAREHEWAVRRRVNPFRCGGPRLHYQTGFGVARLYDWCLDHGLDPPGVTPDSRAWADWWQGHHAAFTDAQRAAVWEVLDRVRFFRVAEAEPAAPMHLVGLPHYELDPITLNLFGQRHYVGSTPYMLVRSATTADALSRELYINGVAGLGEYGGAVPTDFVWAGADSDPFGGADRPDRHASEVDPDYYAEHRPLGLQGDRRPVPGLEVFVVLRRGWRLEFGERNSWRWTPTEARTCGRAVAAFGTLAAADAHMARLEAEARRYPSPFRFGSALEWGTLHASGVWRTLSGLAPVRFTNLWGDYRAPDRMWNEWWDEAVPNLTDEQVAVAWGLFENLRFYEVVAVEFRE